MFALENDKTTPSWVQLQDTVKLFIHIFQFLHSWNQIVVLILN